MSINQKAQFVRTWFNGKYYEFYDLSGNKIPFILNKVTIEGNDYDNEIAPTARLSIFVEIVNEQPTGDSSPIIN